MSSIEIQGKVSLGYNFSNPGIEECALSYFDSQGNNCGGFLSLRGHNGSNEAQRGSFILGARSADGSISRFLFGDVAGYLTWAGQHIHRITGIGDGWLRFSTNLQICFGATVTSSEGSATISFGAPFSQYPTVTATIHGRYDLVGSTYTCCVEPYSTHFNTYSYRNGTLASGIWFSWIAFGYY